MHIKQLYSLDNKLLTCLRGTKCSTIRFKILPAFIICCKLVYYKIVEDNLD